MELMMCLSSLKLAFHFRYQVLLFLVDFLELVAQRGSCLLMREADERSILDDIRNYSLLLRLSILVYRGKKVRVVWYPGWQVPLGGRRSSWVLLELRIAYHQWLSLVRIDGISPTVAHLLKLLERLRVHHHSGCRIL